MSEGLGPWRGKARIGPAWAVFRGAAGDNALHSHHAIQAFAGPNAKIAGIASNLEGAGFVVPADQAHRAMVGSPGAFLYIDPDTHTGRRITDALREEVRALSDAEGQALSALVAAALEGELDAPDAALAELLGAGALLPCRDERVAAALAAFDQADAPLEMNALAGRLGLSHSRLRHLIRDEIGIPLRSFLLWLKLRRAFENVARGRSLTEAAHAGGFADSAHFSRTCVRMFGASPRNVIGSIVFHDE